MKALIIAGIVFIFIVSIILYQSFFISENPGKSINKNQSNQMQITSIFKNNERIPEVFTCDGDNVSLPLDITDIPKNTKTLAIISDDPDAPAGTWVHWVVFNIPFSQDPLKIGKGESPGTEGTTSFKKIGYGGPCPPSGTHRYFFKAYALDTTLPLKEGATKQQLEKVMQGHILDKAELIGLYSRN